MDVVLAFRARSDIEAAASYLSERSPQAAQRLIDQIARRFEELAQFPMMGPKRSDLAPSLRAILIGHLIAFYIVEPDRIVIVRVLDARMNIDQEFRE